MKISYYCPFKLKNSDHPASEMILGSPVSRVKGVTQATLVSLIIISKRGVKGRGAVPACCPPIE
jgi:hypothetical protein